MRDAPSGEDEALARFILGLRTRGMTDPALLNAFERVPRARFLSGFSPDLLYAPLALPLPCGEEATDPFTVAMHLALLDLRPGMSVLEIGTGSGYQAALLAALGARVTTFERYRSLARDAAARLAGDAFAKTAVSVHHADGLLRGDDAGGYDRMIVNGAVEHFSAQLMDRLAADGKMLLHRKRGSETRRMLAKFDENRFPVYSDLGPSRIGPMRSGAALL